MATYVAGAVMDEAAALLNDTGKSLFTDSVQLPYLRMAYRDLDQEFTLNGLELNLISEFVTTVTAGGAVLPLPLSFFLPINLQEKAVGEADDKYYPITEKADINKLNLVASRTLGVWDFRHNCVNFIAANTDRVVRMLYWRALTTFIDENSPSEIRGGQSYLAFRTAALCALYIGGNKARSDSLNIESEIARDRLLAVYTKNTQGNRARRKPFRIPYLSNRSWTLR